MIILSAVFCSTALFWHIPFKNDKISSLVNEYKILNKNVTLNNKKRSEVIEKIALHKDSVLLIEKLLAYNEDYNTSYEIAYDKYNEIKEVRADSKILFLVNSF